MHCPWAAGRKVGGHYKWHFFLSFSLSSGLIANSPKGSETNKNITIPIKKNFGEVLSNVVLGFQNLAQSCK
jgi:hypothetical protein